MLNKNFKLQVGMKVKIRENLDASDKYAGVVFSNGMKMYRGKEIEIRSVSPNNDRFTLKDPSVLYIFSLEMVDCIISTDSDKRYTLDEFFKEHNTYFCITNIPKGKEIIHPSGKKFISDGADINFFYPCNGNGWSSEYYYIEYSQLILDKGNDMSKKKWKLDEIPKNTYIHNFPSVEKLNELIDFFNKKFTDDRPHITSITESTTLYLANGVKYDHICVFPKCPKDTNKTIIDYSNIIIEGKEEKCKIKFKDLKYPCVIINIKNDPFKKQILQKKIPDHDFLHLDVQEIVFYSNGRYEGYCNTKGYCASQEDYKTHYKFYSFDEIDFSEKGDAPNYFNDVVKSLSESLNILSEKTDLQKNIKCYKSKIDTGAPKIVGEYTSAYRKYKPKKGE